MFRDEYQAYRLFWEDKNIGRKSMEIPSQRYWKKAMTNDFYTAAEELHGYIHEVLRNQE